MAVAIALIAAALGAGYAWVSAQRRARETEAARWRTVEAQLRSRMAQLEKERDAARAGQPVPQAGETPRATQEPLPKAGPSDTAARLDLIHVLQDRERQLAAAEGSVRELQAKVQDLTAKLEGVQDQQAKLQTSELVLRDRVDALTQQSARFEAAATARQSRIAEIEAANRDFRSKAEDASKRLARLRQLSDDLEDLSRRREAYLTNISGRYREATDLFRALSVRLESPREGSTPVTANDFSRIQNAISLADEDMRQLRGLSTRVSVLQKDLREIARK